MTGQLPQRLRTAWSEFVGPEATAIDTAITVGLAVLGAVMAVTATRTSRRTSIGESLILRTLAFDLWGGAWVNNTKACVRWYERPDQTDADQVPFAAMHLHPPVLAWLDRGQPRRVPAGVWAGAHHGYLMASTLAIRHTSRQRRRLGVALTAAGGFALDAMLGPSRSAPWFAPSYYTKLLLGHASAALWPDNALTELPASVGPGVPEHHTSLVAT
ncbi:MAG: hypothetical protein WAM92_11080 [Mycobacterium sp.]